MTGNSQSRKSSSQFRRLAKLFPNADAQIVSALFIQRNALIRYLAQIHELTPAEATEALEAIAYDETAGLPQTKVA